MPWRAEPRLLVDWLDVFFKLEKHDDVNVVAELLVTTHALEEAPPSTQGVLQLDKKT